MIQHDSVGDQFFVPLGLDSDGNVRPTGLFSLEGELEHGIVQFSGITGRKMVVVSSPPCRDEIQTSKHLVFLYDGADTKVNELVDIYGIFQGKFELDAEYPHNLPTIHALQMVPRRIPSSWDASATRDASVTKDACLKFFTSCGFDSSGSEKLLLALMSRISSRSPGLLTSLLIGHYPLNIRLQHDAKYEGLVEFLTELVPYSKLIKLSPQELETGEFASKMNYESGVLEQGVLQIPSGTLVIIDERALVPGKLTERASKNMQALIDMIMHQTVQYDFGGQPISVHTNVPIISLSHGKSILPIEDFIVATNFIKLDPTDAPAAFAGYIQYCRAIDVDITEETAREIEEFYVDQRKAGNGDAADPNHLSRVLNISRLISASCGCNQMSMEHFKRALILAKI
ncbi:hypothetical protein PSACC_03082 [Paramicrosporidium saccamoebae]|uniref:Mini-chromosome maintenance complex-binding protein n=1 Tax=Paramicrosporidium saccamoebae TaxID=1246581 RepID=A0A2H9TH52_9FUNG|nr:hypothetical protein PSACC_03082 [Paramicrosporidium saccamoebae]